MALDGFYPKDFRGFAAEVFTDFTQIFPLMSFLMSVNASSFGSSKFFLLGPLRLLPQKAPLHGILSFTFITALFVNISFVFRLFAIEHIFFSHFEKYYTEKSIEKFGHIMLEPGATIEPILSPELRLPIYFLPIIPSMVINIFSLSRSLNFKSLFKLLLTFPQYFIAPCFFPVIFEGIIIDDPKASKSNFKIKVWKLGSIINAIYIMFVPQIIVIFSDVLRGVTDWNFQNAENSKDAFKGRFLEHNSTVFKHPFGNIVLALLVIILCSGGLLFLFRKANTLFELSDVLATCPHDTTSWKIKWIRETSPNHAQTNNVEVRFVT